MRIYNIYASVSATGAGQASTQIIRNGSILAVTWAIGINSVTDDSSLYAELSLQAVNQTPTNGAQGVVSMASWYANGTAPIGQLNFQQGVDCPVGAGEYLYLNSTIAGTLAANIRIAVMVRER